MRITCNRYIVIRVLVIVLAALGTWTVFGCGGSAVPTTPTEVPIPIDGLDGETDVDVSSSFSYTFDQAVDVDTVTTTTFFVVEDATGSASIALTKADLNSSICNVNNALDATVSCESDTVCTLDPTNDLSDDMFCAICLTRGILYADESAFEGFMARFSTGSTAPSPLPEPSV